MHVRTSLRAVRGVSVRCDDDFGEIVPHLGCQLVASARFRTRLRYARCELSRLTSGQGCFAMITSNNNVSDRTYSLPPLGRNPSSKAQGTSPGSFSLLPKIASGRVGRWTFASPDTPGMPAPSEKTAWDFMPLDWTLQAGVRERLRTGRGVDDSGRVQTGDAVGIGATRHHHSGNDACCRARTASHRCASS